MAAGVGKTYRMLADGRAEAASGRDVVIGYLEPHGRAETEAQAVGLEQIPHRRIMYRDRTLDELDLPGVLARRPQLCLIDELAHTNAAGMEHAKRWQDVEAVLEAGIDVWSTVNVQHLESLNDQVAQLTGVNVRETLPDRVLATADEVLLIDLPPDQLLDRMRAGKIYPAERIGAALNGFFKTEHLAALREVALRQVAEEVEAKRLVVKPVRAPTRDDRVSPSAVTVSERLLALVTPTPRSQRVVRRAFRSAQRLGAELDLVWVTPPDRALSEEEQEQLEGLRRLASVLGAHVLIEPGDDVVTAVKRVAAERGTTYVLLGVPSPRTGLRRFSEPLPMRLVRSLPGIDVRIVADRTAREEPSA
ncbi:MAG: histidine kinase [Solirubrobacteraceae bacterium]|nr:histidine kinase [Solirubrobacteraceae bacterium]